MVAFDWPCGFVGTDSMSARVPGGQGRIDCLHQLPEDAACGGSTDNSSKPCIFSNKGVYVSRGRCRQYFVTALFEFRDALAGEFRRSESCNCGFDEHLAPSTHTSARRHRHHRHHRNSAVFARYNDGDPDQPTRSAIAAAGSSASPAATCALRPRTCQSRTPKRPDDTQPAGPRATPDRPCPARHQPVAQPPASYAHLSRTSGESSPLIQFDHLPQWSVALFSVGVPGPVFSRRSQPPHD